MSIKANEEQVLLFPFVEGIDEYKQPIANYDTPKGISVSIYELSDEQRNNPIFNSITYVCLTTENTIKQNDKIERGNRVFIVSEVHSFRRYSELLLKEA